MATAVAALAGHPDDWLIGEDRLLETLSAVLYASASVIAIALLLRLRRAAHPALWFIAPFAMICALDEISFGARLFAIEMPPLKGGGEFDGAHDVIILVVREAQAMDPALLALLLGGTVAVCILLAWLLRRRLAALTAHVIADPVLFRLAICFGFLVVSQVLDVEVLDVPKAMYFEEWAETSGGYWILSAVLAAPRSHGVAAAGLRPATAPQASSAISPTANRIA
ncbi:hypothetical protein [Elioraea rosea]|uniref:hypothetical protein n=1 Tax=Elioraea rosea TaxID=2492390 RepID=UPI001182DEC2|nr:hypothetical protein [Elioraea rosea]